MDAVETPLANVVTDAVETPPTDVVEVYQEESEVSSLSSPESQDENHALGVNASAAISKAGRPKGTTNEKKREIAATRKKCLNSITTDYATILTVKNLRAKESQGDFSRKSSNPRERNTM